MAVQVLQRIFSVVRVEIRVHSSTDGWIVPVLVLVGKLKVGITFVIDFPSLCSNLLVTCKAFPLHSTSIAQYFLILDFIVVSQASLVCVVYIIVCV